MQLISDEYRRQNRLLHRDSDVFGTSGYRYQQQILNVVRQIGARTLLDYGCGKGTLKKWLNVVAPELLVTEYDPAVPGKTDLPEAAHVVVASDVLEHIEPEFLDRVLEHMESLNGGCVWALVHHKAALKSLPDGRNAHLIQKDQHWWKHTLGNFFAVDSVYTAEVDELTGEPIRTVYLLIKANS